MGEFVTINGLDEVKRALAELPKELGNVGGGPLRAAAAAGTRIMRDQAIQTAPVRSGNLQKQVFMYRDRTSPPGTERYLISVRTGRRAKRVSRAYRKGRISMQLRLLGGGDAWYWKWVEFGTAKMGARPFLRNAFESTKHATVTEFVRVFGNLVPKAIARARQKGGA